MSLYNWMLTYNGVTKSMADWGLVEGDIDFKSFDIDELTFRAAGRPYDAAPLFPYKAPLTLADANGKIVFTGIVTKLPVTASPRAEDQKYVVSGPWYWFEHLIFQMEWNEAQGVSSGQVTGTLVSTLRATVLVGNQADGTSENLSQVCSAVVAYVQSAGPTVPFQLGSVVPNLVIPQTEIKDVTCAQILKTIFSYVPDAGTWFDYSTATPTLYIGRRDQLTPVSIPATGGPLSGIDLTPRNDLVVPAVVIKYLQTNTIDGTTYSQIVPDIYPPNAPDPAFDNLVVDVSLLPGNATYQKQTLQTTDRPKDYDSIANTGALTNSALSWIRGQHRSPWLKGYIIPANWPAGQAPYIQGNTSDQDVFVAIPDTDLQVRRIVTNLTDSSKPLKLGSVTVPPGGGPGSASGGGNALDILDQELISGSVPPWLTQNQNIYSAKVNIAATIQYLGSDPVAATWFTPGPTSVLTLNYPTTVTNGSSQTYSQLASETPSEPMPVGLAKQIYQGVSVLHYQGNIELTEQECSGLVGMGNSVNISGAVGAAAAYATMNAQPFGITWNLDEGKTVIKVGPPMYLSAGKLTEILRAIRGRIPTSHANEQQTGKTDGDNSVQGAGDTSHAGATTPPGGSAAAPTPLPFQVTVRPSPSNPSLYQAKVNINSDLLLSLQPSNSIAISGLDTWFNFIANDLISLYIVISDYAVTSATIQSYGAGTTSFDPTLAAWDSSDDSYVFDDGTGPPNAQQIGANVMIAYSTPDATGKPFLVQAVFSHLIMLNVVIDGRAAVYAFPATSRRYGVTA